MTLIDYRLFAMVPSSEYTNKAFMKETTSPYLTALSNRFNDVTPSLPPAPCSLC